MSKLGSGDKTITISIEHLKGLDKLLLSISILHFTGHEGKELWEINGSVTIGIDLIDHILKLSLSWVLTKRSHNSTELLGGNGTITILIEKGESFLELSDLFFSKVVRHLLSFLSKFGEIFKFPM